MLVDVDVAMQKQTIEKMIGVAFTTRNYAHAIHLCTDKYALHNILEDFYEDIIDPIDNLAEIWQGKTLMRIGEVPAYKPNYDADVLEEFRRHVELLEDLRTELGESSVIDGLVDAVLEVYYKTIYKLAFLCGRGAGPMYRNARQQDGNADISIGITVNEPTDATELDSDVSNAEEAMDEYMLGDGEFNLNDEHVL